MTPEPTIIAARVRVEPPKPWDVAPPESTPLRDRIRRMLAEASGDDEATKDVLRWVQETS